jgi:hypothetical protein
VANLPVRQRRLGGKAIFPKNRRFFMKNQRIWLGILVMVMILVFGMTAFSCKEEEPDEIDPALNGTWVKSYNYDGYEYEGERIKLDNGKFEAYDMGVKGTYTTKDGKITGRTTQVKLDSSKWYTKDEVKAFAKANYAGALLVEAEAQIDAMFKSQTVAYSISGNKLTIIGGDLAGTWTKQ